MLGDGYICNHVSGFLAVNVEVSGGKYMVMHVTMIWAGFLGILHGYICNRFFA